MCQVGDLNACRRSSIPLSGLVHSLISVSNAHGRRSAQTIHMTLLVVVTANSVTCDCRRVCFCLDRSLTGTDLPRFADSLWPRHRADTIPGDRGTPRSTAHSGSHASTGNPLPGPRDLRRSDCQISQNIRSGTLMPFGVGVRRLHRPLVFALQAIPLLLRCFALHVRQSVIMAYAFGDARGLLGFCREVAVHPSPEPLLESFRIEVPKPLPISSQL